MGYTTQIWGFTIQADEPHIFITHILEDIPNLSPVMISQIRK